MIASPVASGICGPLQSIITVPVESNPRRPARPAIFKERIQSGNLKQGLTLPYLLFF